MRHVVSLFFRADHIGSAQPVAGLWQDVLVLVQAADEQEALRIGEEIGRSKEHEYYVSEPNHHLVRWTFVKAERACLIEGEIAHGVEVFSRFLRASEAESVLRPFDDE